MSAYRGSDRDMTHFVGDDCPGGHELDAPDPSTLIDTASGADWGAPTSSPAGDSLSPAGRSLLDILGAARHARGHYAHPFGPDDRGCRSDVEQLAGALSPRTLAALETGLLICDGGDWPRAVVVEREVSDRLAALLTSHMESHDQDETTVDIEDALAAHAALPVLA